MTNEAVVFDSRWIGDHGIGRFAKEVRRSWERVVDLGGDHNPAAPFDSIRLSLQLVRLRSAGFFYSPGYNAPLDSRMPFAITVHDLSHIDCELNRTWAKSVYYKFFLRPACRRARLVLTVSEYARQRICEWSGLSADKVFNVGNGVDPLFRPDGQRLRRQRPYLLCLGNRRPHKNEPRTLEAFALVAERFADFDLVFSGPRTDELSGHAERLQLGSRVHFLGRISDEALANAYRGASLVLFASLYEGFGLPVVEAQACGTPVITSKVCAIPEVAGDAACLVNPNSKLEIAEAIERVLTAPSVAADLAARGILNAARFSWADTRAKVHRLVDEAANA